MAARGVHFAINDEQAQRLLGAEDDEELVGIVEEIEEEWEAAFETDKAWDALHRCLSDGTLNVTEGEPPLNRAFFGGRVLNEEPDYFVVLTTPAEVQELADALVNVSEEWIRKRYRDTPFPDYQGEKSNEARRHKGNVSALLAEFAEREAKFLAAEKLFDKYGIPPLDDETAARIEAEWQGEPTPKRKRRRAA